MKRVNLIIVKKSKFASARPADRMILIASIAGLILSFQGMRISTTPKVPAASAAKSVIEHKVAMTRKGKERRI